MLNESLRVTIFARAATANLTFDVKLFDLVRVNNDGASEVLFRWNDCCFCFIETSGVQILILFFNLILFSSLIIELCPFGFFLYRCLDSECFIVAINHAATNFNS